MTSKSTSTSSQTKKRNMPRPPSNCPELLNSTTMSLCMKVRITSTRTRVQNDYLAFSHRCSFFVSPYCLAWSSGVSFHLSLHTAPEVSNRSVQKHTHAHAIQQHFCSYLSSTEGRKEGRNGRFSPTITRSRDKGTASATPSVLAHNGMNKTVTHTI